MREILFKAKRKNNGEWVEGDLFHNDNTNYPMTLIGCLILSRNKYTDDICIDGYCLIEVDPETVCQYTGLKDMNGKKIWENDIVRAESFRFIVKYGKCGGVPNTTNYGYMGFYLEAADEETQKYINYGLRNDICYFDDIEVIGNAFDEVTE